MSLPPVPEGYDSWNQFIEINGAIIAAEQGLTFQEGKASAKLLYVAEPVRQAVGTPSFRIYNVFTTWAARTVSPTQGRPWRDEPEPISGNFLITQNGNPLITQSGDNLVTN
jgi:hypothetical protein